MNYFAIKPGEILDLAGLRTRCEYCNDRHASFVFEQHGDGCLLHRNGWLDVHWISSKDDQHRIYLRLALLAQDATPNRVLQIKDEIYGRLGIPTEFTFELHLIDFAHTLYLPDDRCCITSSPVGKMDGDRSFFPWFHG
jgi:hypothetical protein